MRIVRVALVIVALACFAVAISYPIRYHQQQEENDTNMEKLADMRLKAREGQEGALEAAGYMSSDTQPGQSDDETASEAPHAGNEPDAQGQSTVDTVLPPGEETAPQGEAGYGRENEPEGSVDTHQTSGETEGHAGAGETGGVPEGHAGAGETGGVPEGYAGTGETGGVPEGYTGAGETGGVPEGYAGAGETGGVPEGYAGTGKTGGVPEGYTGAGETGGVPEGYTGAGETGGVPEDGAGSGETGGNPSESGGTTENGALSAQPVQPTPRPTPTPTPEPTLDPYFWDLSRYMTPVPTSTPRAMRATTEPTPVPTPTPDRSIRTGPLPYPLKDKVVLDEAAILPELKDIYALNNDLAGWLTIPDTVIDYPVVQAENGDFYLDHDFYGDENINGQIILDPQCDPYTPSYNLILSGHHMKNGSMFGGLPQYRNKSYWEKHKFLEFDSLMTRKAYVIFACFYSADYDEDEKGFRYNAVIDYKMDAEVWLPEIEKNQLYDTGIERQFGDEFITLTTCDRARHRNGRFVVVARRIREGETFE